MAQWYYGENGVQQGPVDDAQLAALIQVRRVGPATPVWREGMSDWRTLAQVEAAEGAFVPLAVGSPWSGSSHDGGMPYDAPPVTYYQPGMGVRTSGLAVASLVCGILGLVTCLLVPGVPAVICGHMALAEIDRAPTAVAGRGMAMAGLITGYLCILPLVGFLIYFVFMFVFIIASVL